MSVNIKELNEKYHIFDDKGKLIVGNLIEAIEKGDTQESDWEKALKEVLVYDSTNNEVQCGVHFYCDGDLETDSDIVCGRDFCIDSLQNIQDNDGNAFIPDPSGKLNQALVHYTSGYTWKKGYELAGFQVIAKSTFEGSGFVYQTNIVYFVFNDTDGEHYGEVYVRYYEH